MDLGLHDSVALVTGGCRGIGRAIVELLRAAGARVVVADRELALGEQLAAADPGVVFVGGELRDEAVCARAVATASERFGRLDALVHNAGRNDGVGLDAGCAAFEASLRDNLVPAYALMHYASGLLAQARGSVTLLGSKVAVTGQGGTSGYAAAKGGLLALVREWAVELAPHGARSNAVLPAETWTPLYEEWLARQADPAGERARIERTIPLGRRFTTPAEIAAAVVFLASKHSSHTTGQILFVDGGYTHLDRRCTS